MPTTANTEVFAAQPIVIDRLSGRIDAFRADESDTLTIRHALDAYGHLLRAQLETSAPKRYSFGEFARVIEQHYAVSNPRTAEVVRVLQFAESMQQQIAGLPVPLARAC